jgi:hypothetical protein
VSGWGRLLLLAALAGGRAWAAAAELRIVNWCGKATHELLTCHHRTSAGTPYDSGRWARGPPAPASGRSADGD